MDADTIAIAPDLRCDACGYPRRGLDADARCPECGEPALKVPVNNNGSSVESLFDDPLRSPSELLWLRLTAIGLVILLAYWLAALQVTLIMPIGSFSLGAMNFAGPKLNLAATVQRSIGRQAGEWGVLGCSAAFMEAIGIWLVTTARFADSRGEPTFSLRSITRWSAMLAVGATLGLVLSNDGETLLMPMSNQTGGLLIWAILLGELPVNTLLYLYLLRLSRTLHSRRAAKMFFACAWMVPAVTFGGVLLVTIDIRRAVAPEPLWYVITAVYGASAVATAAGAVTGVLHLLGTTALAGFGRPFAASLVAVRTLPRYLRTAAQLIADDWARWAVVAGLLLWVGLVPANLRSVLWAPSRIAFLGNLPSFNFLGPKLIAALLNDNRFDRYFVGDLPVFEAPVLPSLLAICLMTAPLSRHPSDRKLRTLVRVVSVLAVGMPLGVRLAMWSDQEDVSKLIAYGVTFCEVPATVLVYLYLARLAATVKGPVRTFVGVAIAVPIVAGSPMLGFVLSRKLALHEHSPRTAALAGLHASVSLTVTLLACAAILQLAWKLVAAPAIARRPSTGTALESAS